MPSSLRNEAPLNFTAKGLSDALDGTNVARGAMRTLTNLIPDPRNAGLWICRPGATVYIDFAGTFDTPNQITALRAVGDVAYGMVSTNRFPGHDEPFYINLQAGAFIPVSGPTSANTPLSPPLTGEWEPPIVKKIGSRVLVTHPGFESTANKFGWFDVSGFSLHTTGNVDEQRVFVGDTDTTHQPYIVGLPPGTLPGAADVGFTVTGSGIPANTTILGVEDVGVAFAGDTNGTINVANLTVGGIASTAGLYIGQVVQGSDIPAGTQIATINRGAFTMTMTQAATGPGIVGESLAAVGRQVHLSNAATATADAVTFTFFDESVITGNPTITGIQTGMAISGGGIPPGTSVVSTTTTEIDLSGLLVVGSNAVQVLIYPSGISLGMLVTGAGIPVGATVIGTTGTLTAKFILISSPPTAAGWTNLTITGAQIRMSADASPQSIGAALTISGGTASAPLWAAGDTQPINLPQRPVGLGELYGRAYFCLGEDGIGFSDPLRACQISEATQFLIPGNGVACTAAGEGKVTSTTLGGNVAALFIFQRDADMQQIMGDPTTSNLTLTDLRCSTGTHAPLTICPTTKGTFFVSPEGLRLVDFSGRVSDPIGQDGSGIVGPFIDVTNPPLTGDLPASRMCSAANGRTVRTTVPVSTDIAASGFAEYWYDIARGIWYGPHPSTAGVITDWSNTFLLAPTAPYRRTELWQSDDVQRPGSVFIENSDDMLYEYETTLLPDTGQMAENTIIESSIMVALPPAEQIQVNFLNEIRQNLSGFAVVGYTIPQAIWGDGVWDLTYAGPDQGFIRQRRLEWDTPIVFKQGSVNIRGLSSSGIVLGNLYLRYQIGGYMLEVQQIPDAPAGFFLLSNGMRPLFDNGYVKLRPR